LFFDLEFGPLLMTSCLFCGIIAGERPAAIVYQDDRMVAIDDIHPQAPMHVLVIPRRHIDTLNDLTADDDGLAGAMIRRAAAIASDRGYADRGYRVLFNCNREAGQSVYHIHLHLLGGRRLGWPPG
jgi:histidine triad (HIT) family protein